MNDFRYHSYYIRRLATLSYVNITIAHQYHLSIADTYYTMQHIAAIGQVSQYNMPHSQLTYLKLRTDKHRVIPTYNERKHAVASSVKRHRPSVGQRFLYLTKQQSIRQKHSIRINIMGHDICF